MRKPIDAICEQETEHELLIPAEIKNTINYTELCIDLSFEITKYHVQMSVLYI